MGSNVDSKLTEHIVTRIFREKYQLAGQSGTIPSFFDQIVLIEGDPNRRARFHRTENGDLTLTLIPKTLLTGDTVTITVDAKEIRQIEGIQNRIIDRQRRRGKSISFSEPIRNTANPHFSQDY
jgi:hypothetical protein